jgi:hypothetical protein
MDDFADSNSQSVRNLFIDPDAPIPSPSPVQLERANAQPRLRALSQPVGLGGAAVATPSPIVGRSAAEVFTEIRMHYLSPVYLSILLARAQKALGRLSSLTANISICALCP